MGKMILICLFLVIIIVSFLVLVEFNTFYVSEAYDKHLEEFYSADIKNRIDTLEKAYHQTLIKLDNGKEYYFFPHADKALNDNTFFMRVAKRGDSIVKPAMTDTVFLYKEELVYKYLFN